MRNWKRRTRSLRTPTEKQYRLWRKKARKRHEKIASALVKFARSPYVEDCRYHPCRVTALEPMRLDPRYFETRLDLDCESLVSGATSACSYFHCGIVLLTEEEAFDRRDYILRFGMWPYQFKYIYQSMPPEQVAECVSHLLEMEKTWGFAKNAATPPFTEEGRQLVLAQYGVDMRIN